jgi:hypothetical protein
MFLARRECRGALYNIRAEFVRAYSSYKGLPEPPFYTRYVCGQYSKRLRDYLIGRRNGTAKPETALAMNGFEGCQYVIEGAHDWFGFHLSGTSVEEEPIFIDPWWTQEWNIAEIKDNYGFKMQAARTTAVSALLAAEFVLLCYFIRWFIKEAIVWWRARGGTMLVFELDLSALRALLMESVQRWIWNSMIVTGGLTTWYLEAPPNSDTALFDSEYNYSHYTELELFTRYRDDLLRTSPAPAQTVESWPT